MSLAQKQSFITRLPKDMLAAALGFVGKKGWKPLFVRGVYDDDVEFYYKITKTGDGYFHFIGVEDQQSFVVDMLHDVISMIADMVSLISTCDNAKDYQFDCFYENAPEDTVFVSFTDGVAVIDHMIQVRNSLLKNLSLLGVVRNS